MACAADDFSGEPNRILRSAQHPARSEPARQLHARRVSRTSQIPRDAFGPRHGENARRRIHCRHPARRQQLPHQSVAETELGPGRCPHRSPVHAQGQFLRALVDSATETIAPYKFPAVQIPGVPRRSEWATRIPLPARPSIPRQHAVASYTKVLSPRLINDCASASIVSCWTTWPKGVRTADRSGNLLGVKNSNTQPLQSALPIFTPSGYTGYRSNPFAADFPPRKHVPVHGQHDFDQGRAHVEVRRRSPRRQITEYQTNRGNGRFNFSPAFTDYRGAVAEHRATPWRASCWVTPR